MRVKTEMNRATVNKIIIDDCWNRVGVHGKGDRSCVELRHFIHCRNCNKFISEGRKLLDRESTAEYKKSLYGQIDAISDEQEKTESVVIFRLGDEWFGLPPHCFNEVIKWREIHSIPHNRSDKVKGLVAIRGKLQLCISIGHVLGVTKGKVSKENIKEGIYKRMIVFLGTNGKYVFPVSEIREIHHYSISELCDPPATSASNDSQNVVRGVLYWNDRYLSCLNFDKLSDLIDGIF